MFYTFLKSGLKEGAYLKWELTVNLTLSANSSIMVNYIKITNLGWIYLL